MTPKPLTAPTLAASHDELTGPPPQSAIEALIMELYWVVIRGMTLRGVPIGRQKQLFRQSYESSARNSVSGALLEQFRNMSDLLTAWLRELPYVDGTGRPRILPIKGSGATFESLARQFLPEKPLEEVLALALETARVDTLPGGRIAVHGDTFVNPVARPEIALAQTIAHIVQIINTSQLDVIAQGDTIVGRYERLVALMLDPDEFEGFNREIREQLADLVEKTEALLKAQIRKGTRRKRGMANAGIGVYVFYDDVEKNLGAELNPSHGHPLPRS